MNQRRRPAHDKGPVQDSHGDAERLVDELLKGTIGSPKAATNVPLPALWQQQRAEVVPAGEGLADFAVEDLRCLKPAAPSSSQCGVCFVWCVAPVEHVSDDHHGGIVWSDQVLHVAGHPARHQRAKEPS
eukprot:287627-Prymnesium_polylepis.1